MRRYFQSLSYWHVDLVLCFIVSAVATPADPMTMLIVFVPLSIVWMVIRFAIARHLSKHSADVS